MASLAGDHLDLFRQAIAGAPESMMVLGADGRVVSCNARMAQMTGHHPEALVGTHYGHPPRPSGAWLPVDRKLVEAALGGQATHRDEVELPCGIDEDPRWASDDFVPLKQRDGTVMGVLVVLREVTAHKLAERMLRQASQFHRQVIDSALEGIAVLDTNLRFVLFNALFEQMTGLSAAQVLGAHPSEVFPELAHEILPLLTAALAGSVTERAEVYLRGRGTRPGRWISDTVSPMRAPDGTITGAIVCARDITTRKQAEESVRQAHERTSAALVAAGIGVWELDLETRRMTWTENLAALFGRAIEDQPGAFGDGMKYVHPQDAATLQEKLDAAISRRESFDVSFRIIRPDGVVRWLQASAHVLASPQGEASRLLGVTSDVTQRRLLEEQFRQAQKMEAVGQLAGGVAHDFNNLLTAILGYSHFLLEGLTSDQQRRDVEEVVKAADRATGLTRQLLLFSRQQPLDTSVFGLDSVVADVAHMLRRLIGEHVTLHSAVDPEAGLVRADRGQIEQVLMNLVINARDAMPDGGTITISTARTYLSQSEVLGAEPLPAGAYVVLAVADEGTGMSEETRLRIFEPFFTTKGPGRGTGLGLATVFGIVTQLKGGIRVDSAVGQGTTFSIYLPLADEPAAAVVATRHATPDVRHHETILLVEDEAPVRDLARMILERGGYRVFQASDPLGAEELFDTAAGMADVLVTDVIMPGGRGTDLFARLSRRNPALRAVYVSGYTADAFPDDTVFGAGQVFLQKPFRADSLLQKIREAIGD